MSLKSRVEAVLFLTDKPVVAAVVAKLVNEDVQLVRQAIMQLIYDYEQRNCALEISDDDDGYMMQVKDEFANLANDLAPIDLPVSVVRTLSAIAIKQPVLQSEIVRIRGAGAYEHITALLEKELITKKEEGRSHLLSTTKKFQEYFRLSQDAKALRNQLKDQDKEEQLGNIDQQLELPLDSESALQPLQSSPDVQSEPDHSQVLSSGQQDPAPDEIEQLSQSNTEKTIEPANQTDSETTKEQEPSISSIADWSQGEDEPTSSAKPANTRANNNNPEAENNISVSDNRFMAAPTVN